MGRPHRYKEYEKQETEESILDRAKAECDFSDRLYEVLLAQQRGEKLPGRPPNTPPGNVGELNEENSRIYNLIWTAAIDLNGKKKRQEVIA